MVGVKPARFEYHVPSTLTEAVETLAALVEDAEAKVIAGGQSLVPLMNMRLSRPDHLIDLRDLAELHDLRVDEDTVTVGSMVTQRTLERSAQVAQRNGLLTCAASHIAHFQIRERGTVGGSVSHADPSAELPLVATVLDASLDVRGRAGTRTLSARDFFVSFLTTALDEDEVVTAVRFRSLGPDEGWGFREFSRRRGDFALVGAAATVRLVGGRYDEVRIGFSGVSGVPVLAEGLDDLVLGEEPSPRLAAEVAQRAAARVEPTSDIHATAEDRRDLMRHLSAHVLQDATARTVHKGAEPDPLQLP